MNWIKERKKDKTDSGFENRYKLMTESTFNKPTKQESVEEYLKRGGKIKKLTPHK